MSEQKRAKELAQTALVSLAVVGLFVWAVL